MSLENSELPKEKRSIFSASSFRSSGVPLEQSAKPSFASVVADRTTQTSYLSSPHSTPSGVIDARGTCGDPGALSESWSGARFVKS